MASDDRILSDQEVILDVMSRDFFNLEMPVTDFNLFLHCDVNEIFSNLPLNIPLTDGAPLDTTSGDQNQPTTGSFAPADWRLAYRTHIQTNQAYRSASYSTDRTNPNILCNLVREILSELFLGNKSDTANNLQTGVYGTSRLRFKTEHLYPWLNADDETKVGLKALWGVDCFQEGHFGSIHRALVAKNKYTAILAADNVTRTHGVINLSEGDSIGVRVTLKENASNLVHVNFYLQQTDGYESVAPLIVPAFSGSNAVIHNGASYSVSASSQTTGSEAYKSCDDSSTSWTSASGVYDAFTGEHKATGDTAKIKHGREGEFVRVAVDTLRALTEVKWDFGATAGAAGTPKDFRIMISFNQVDYVVLHDVANYMLSGPQSLNLTGKEYFAKDVVLHITKIHKNDTLTACSVVEFMIDSSVPAAPAIVTPHNLTGNASSNGFEVSASSIFNSTYDAYQAFSGTVGWWASGPNSFDAQGVSVSGEFLTVALSAPTTVSTFKYRPPSEVPTLLDNFTIQVSPDGSNWTGAETFSSVAAASVVGPDGYITFNLQQSAVGNYVRLLITKITQVPENPHVAIEEIDYS